LESRSWTINTMELGGLSERSFGSACASLPTIDQLRSDAMARSLREDCLTANWVEPGPGLVYSDWRFWCAVVTQLVLSALCAHVGCASTKRRRNVFNR